MWEVVAVGVVAVAACHAAMAAAVVPAETLVKAKAAVAAVAA
jgi:hypothetical protein